MKTRSAIAWSFPIVLGYTLFVGRVQAQPIRLDQAPAANGPSLVTPLAAPSPPAGDMTAGNIVAEVEKMVQSGTDAGVIKAFIQNWTGRYSVSADQLLHLRDVGASTDILTTLIHRSAELQAQTTVAPQPPAMPGPETVPAPGPVYPEMAVPNAPAAPYSYTSPYPAYTDSYPYPSYLYPTYAYPYAYSPWWPNYWYSYYYPWFGYRYHYWGARPGYYHHYPMYSHGYRPVPYGHAGAAYGRGYGYSGGGFRGSGGYGRGHR